MESVDLEVTMVSWFNNRSEWHCPYNAVIGLLTSPAKIPSNRDVWYLYC